jgi:hypothetical protein
MLVGIQCLVGLGAAQLSTYLAECLLCSIQLTTECSPPLGRIRVVRHE